MSQPLAAAAVVKEDWEVGHQAEVVGHWAEDHPEEAADHQQEVPVPDRDKPQEGPS